MNEPGQLRKAPSPAWRPSRRHTERVGPAPRSPSARMDAFDVLRASAMILIVTLHAALAYTTHVVPRLVWAVHDHSAHGAFDVLFDASIRVALPMFFLISGFFSAGTYNRLGPRGFALDRLIRIGLPTLVVGAPVLVASYFVWSYGWVTAELCTLEEVIEFQFRSPVLQSNRIGPAHLWFVEYLGFLLIAYALWRWAASRRPAGIPGPGARLCRMLARPAAAWALALPTAAILIVGQWAMGLDPAVDCHNTLLINPFRLVHHALFFCAGAALRGEPGLLERFSGRAWRLLATAVVAFAGREVLADASPAAWPDGLVGAAIALATGLYEWAALLGLVGLATRYYSRPRRTVRLLADASFWVYLIHLPIVGLIQVDLAAIPGEWSCWWKFPVVLGMTLTVCIASHRWAVRGTCLNQWIHGRLHT